MNNSTKMSTATYEMCERLLDTPRDDISAQKFLLRSVLETAPEYMRNVIVNALKDIDLYVNSGIGEGVEYDLIPDTVHDTLLVSSVSDGRSTYMYAVLGNEICDGVATNCYIDALTEVVGLVKDHMLDDEGAIRVVCHKRSNGYVKTGNVGSDLTELSYEYNGEKYKARDRAALSTHLFDMDVEDWIDASSHSIIIEDQFEGIDMLPNYVWHIDDLSGDVTKSYFENIEDILDVLKHSTMLEMVIGARYDV